MVFTPTRRSRGVVPVQPLPGSTNTNTGTDRSAAPVDDTERFADQVILAGAAVRVSALLSAPRPGTLYQVADRNGISVTAVPSTALTDGEVADLLAFRFAQYLDIGFVDRRIACAQNMRQEPTTVVAPGDVHIVAGVPGTGEILCYAVVEQPPAVAPGCRVCSTDRDLFAVERVHGAGVFNRLPILPDLAVSKVRELGRFVRNHRPVAGTDLATRAAVEVGVAVFRLMAGPLRMRVDAVVGDLEEHVAKQNLDFFHIPSVVLHSTVPYASSASYLYPRYQRHTVYPFACLTSDIESALPRLTAVERALAKPGRRALLALLRLRMQSRGGAAASMLHRYDGPDPLHELSLLQQQVGMAQRNQLLEQGRWLRQTPQFAGLSEAEAAMLCALMHRIEVRAGHHLAHQGETAEHLYIVERGEASVELTHRAGPLGQVRTLGPGECCGLFGVLAGAAHPADIVATTDMTLLRLSKTDHDTYLTRLPDVQARLGRDALHQLAEVDRHRRLHPTPAVADGDDECGCGPGCACQGHDHGAAHDNASATPPPATPES